MLIYLDTNVYCRPMDDQARRDMRQETEAFLGIQSLAKREKLQILGSDVLRYEITKIANANKKEEAIKNMDLCSNFVEEHAATLALAEDLERSCKLSGRDALHFASAVLGNAELFITCDRALVRKSARINAALKKINRRIAIANPLSFLHNFKGE